MTGVNDVDVAGQKGTNAIVGNWRWRASFQVYRVGYHDFFKVVSVRMLAIERGIPSLWVTSFERDTSLRLSDSFLRDLDQSSMAIALTTKPMSTSTAAREAIMIKYMITLIFHLFGNDSIPIPLYKQLLYLSSFSMIIGYLRAATHIWSKNRTECPILVRRMIRRV